MSICSQIIIEVFAPPSGIWLDYAKTLLVLAGICLLALFAVKVLLPKITGFARPDSSHIKVIAKYPLDPRKTLYLVRTGKTVVFFATSGESFHFMTTLNPGDFEDDIAQVQIESAGSSTFQRIASTFADKNQGKS
jgi:flagellar biogenesis protein FliO